MLDSGEVLRRLGLLQMLYAVVAALMVVVGGDFLFPWLDRQIGILFSDLVEVVVVTGLLYMIAFPQMRELRRSIVSLEDLRMRLYAESILDALTSLYNRRHFDRQIEEEWGRARRYRQPVSLVLLDVDRFKTINDQLGHPAGDAALAHIAERLSRRRRRGDFLARIGGEEFAFLLPAASASAAQSLAEDCRRAIECAPWSGDHGVRLMTVSCGVATMHDSDASPSDLMARADEALYLAKRTRNTVVVHPDDEPGSL